MHWHLEDIPLLIHNIPHALHDLMQYEDKDIVKNGVRALPLVKVATAPAVTIEKTLDRIAQSSAHNIGLLLHNYINQLPEFNVSNEDGEKLLEHWREIMLEQPVRLASAKTSNWHDESTKAFWLDKISSHHKELGMTKENFPDAWDDWQRTSGIGHDLGSATQQAAMQQHRWQDLLIRSRLHKLTKDDGKVI